MLTDDQIFEIAEASQSGFTPHDDTLRFARAILAAHEAAPHPDTVRLDGVIKHHIKVYETMRGGFFALYPDALGGNVATEYHPTPRAAVDEALAKLEATK
jgi:hypothetical protein